MSFKYLIENRYCKKYNRKRMVTVKRKSSQALGASKEDCVESRCFCEEKNSCEYFDPISYCCPAIDDKKNKSQCYVFGKSTNTALSVL